MVDAYFVIKQKVKMKKLFTLSLFILCSVMMAQAENVKIGGIYYILDESAKTATVTQSNTGRYLGNITIPAVVKYEGNDYKVTSIGNSAFSYCGDLTSVAIPEGIMDIGSYAFNGCSGLSSFIIPTTVTNISSFAFKDCSGLTTIEIPDNVIKIDGYAFGSCTRLQSVRLPHNANVQMGGSVFSECSSLKAIEIPEVYTTIKGFDNCTGLESVYIPRKVTSITKGTFNGCINLNSIVVDERNEVYDSRDNCNAIINTSDNSLVVGCKSTIIPNSVVAIASSAFRYCSSLTAIEIPTSVKKIGDSAFSGCSGLTTIRIPNSVTNLGPQAFSSCSGLVTLHIGSGISSVDNNTFSACNGLMDVYCYNIEAPKAPFVNNKRYIFGDKIYSQATLHVPAVSIDSYKTIEPWSYFQKFAELTEEEMATDIHAARINESMASSFITLDGKLHSSPQKGINIIGGKKVVMK